MQWLPFDRLEGSAAVGAEAGYPNGFVIEIKPTPAFSIRFLTELLIWPLRATYLACGAFWWISGISGPFGLCGTDAVVITGILQSVAIFAKAAAWLRSFDGRWVRVLVAHRR